MGQTSPGVASGNSIDQPLNAAAIGRELQIGWAIQQTFQIQRRTLADQLQRKAEGLADRFVAGERQDLKVVIDTVEDQTETSLVGRCKHAEISPQKQAVCPLSDVRDNKKGARCCLAM
ncbi:Epoxyqueuosine reductase QueG [Pseudomonas syringae pv. actinidiae]|uniref:Epoxyqueuosine reductase QueG n=1 Tax=Pseudomonas syringae pv. actinidiae TaxID=103796 RepID=A0AAN4Q0S5_PSESF|nr:Epoxyqueuosine reductase QueG [Pseudomonas syringae pv. actinidiae]